MRKYVPPGRTVTFMALPGVPDITRPCGGGPGGPAYGRIMGGSWPDVLDLSGSGCSDDYVGVTRRELLLAAGIMPLAAGGFTDLSSLAGTDRTSRPGIVRSAFHVHSSFSEGAQPMTQFVDANKTQASMHSHAECLSRLGFDLCMFTDHDHRMAAEHPGQTLTPFPTVEDFAHPIWRYTGQQIGSPASGFFWLTLAGLQVEVTAGSGPGTEIVLASCDGRGWNYRSTLAGSTITVTVIPGGLAIAEMWILSSVRPAMNGRPEGSYGVKYRFAAGAPEGSLTADGTIVTVTIPAIADTENVFVVDPVADLARAFPDLGPLVNDHGLYGLWFGVTALTGRATATFLTWQITRTTGLDEAIEVQRGILAELAPLYPGLRLAQGLEFSYSPTHLNWLATDGVRGVKPSPGVTVDDYLRSCVDVVAAAGGACSYNHMFGASMGPVLTGALRRGKILKTARHLLSTAAYGSHVLEVGYNVRGGMDLAGHIEVWDILLAAGIRIYADGATDNHAGTHRSYVNASNRFCTDILAPSPDPRVALPALCQGRAFVSLLGAFSGEVDLAAAGAVMGQQATVSGTTTGVAVSFRGLPPRSVLRVLQYAMHRNRSIDTRRAPLKTFSRTPAEGAGTMVFRVPSVTSYVRVEVVRSGSIVAFSNPIFLCRA